MKKFFFLSILFFAQQVFSQDKTEEKDLLLTLTTTKNDSTKIATLNSLATYYFNNDQNKAKKFLSEAEKLVQKKPKSYNFVNTLYNKTFYYILRAKLDSADFFCNKTYDLSKKYHYQDLEIKCINAIGMITWNKGNFEKASKYYFEALKKNDELPENKRINTAIIYHNIGNVYIEKRLYQKALEYHKKAYQIRLETNLKRDQASSLNNIGICYENLNDYKKASESYEKGEKIAEKSNNLLMLYKLKYNHAVLYDKTDHQKALKLFLEVYNKPKQLITSEKDRVVMLGVIANTYNKIGNYEESLRYANLGLEAMKRDTAFYEFADNIYNSLSKSYFHLGDIKKGDYYLDLHYKFLDKMFAGKNSQDLADTEVKYQTEKKEKLLLIKELENKKKNVIILIISLLVLFTAILGYLFYRQQKLKNKQQQKEYLLQSAISQIETQNKLQELRLAISRDLHDNIGAQLTFIISTIDNLKYGNGIQDDKISKQLSKISQFTQSTITELRDTIWAMNVNELTFEDLRTRIFNFIEKAKSAKENIEFNFSIDNNLKDKKMTSLTGINLYRTIQEGINNAVKYAEANKIRVEITLNQDHILTEIKDNGKGFDTDTTKKGNGLYNMNKRISEISGHFQLISSLNNGTEIQVKLPKNLFYD